MPEGIGDYYRFDEDDLEELANEHDSALAEQILRWCKLRRDLTFLEAGSQTDRVNPTWGALSHCYGASKSLKSSRTESR